MLTVKINHKPKSKDFPKLVKDADTNMILLMKNNFTGMVIHKGTSEHQIGDIYADFDSQMEFEDFEGDVVLSFKL